MDRIFNGLYYKLEGGQKELLFFNSGNEASIVYKEGEIIKITNETIDLKDYSKIRLSEKDKYEIAHLSTDYDCLYAVLTDHMIIQLSGSADGSAPQNIYLYDRTNDRMTPLGITEYEAAKRRAFDYEPYDLDSLI
ncbi:hypothetical protein HNP38_002143 [Chryseobacterium defluvii]|uniref:Uncharacterized protein n=1 Tax=Chryseobacterium defluvii TaxID=160396 RepID=A0A840KFU9_9FLAO|nr:hypothetical protein [Chryseobacterium defluvii]MBB4806847.1 hypothetical protein [Chryseobacterium defluvii]